MIPADAGREFYLWLEAAATGRFSDLWDREASLETETALWALTEFKRVVNT